MLSADSISNVTPATQRTAPFPYFQEDRPSQLSVNDLDDTALTLLSSAILAAMTQRGLQPTLQPTLQPPMTMLGLSR